MGMAVVAWTSAAPPPTSLGVKLPGADETVFNRTVSANLGMSYSVSNVMAEAGIGNNPALGAVPVDELELRNRIKNKMIRPTTSRRRRGSGHRAGHLPRGAAAVPRSPGP